MLRKNVERWQVDGPYKSYRLTFFAKSLIGIGLVCAAVLLLGARSSAPAERRMLAEHIPPSNVKVSYVPHVVQPGECLSGIADSYRSRWQVYAPSYVVEGAIREYNARLFYNGYILQAGSVINIPVWVRGE